MSRAFVREEDVQQPDVLPELLISPHPNHVTRRGLALIDEKMSELKALLAAEETADVRARLERDLRYWAARGASAQVKEREEGDKTAGFGARVRFRRGDGEPEALEIVGEDEADPAHGRISWVAPLARAMTGAEAGDVVVFTSPQGEVEIEVLGVESI
jgi:transcription elongation GreA/GreB family factor